VVSLTLTEADVLESEADQLMRRARAAKQRSERSERKTKVRGAHAHPPLRSELPPWKTSWPPRTADAADAFDRSYHKRWDEAESVLVSLSRDLTHLAKRDAFEIATMELMMSRYKEPVELERITRYAARARKPKPRKPWRLEDSIWAPRVKWADSRDFWDTDDVEKKMFERDWGRAVACGIGRYILRLDDEEDDTVDGVDEVKETVDVLWEFHDLIYVIFDYYAATALSDDFTHLTMNAFAMFVNDCQFADKHSQFCKSTHFDQLFIAVDASGSGGKTDEKSNRKKALNRQEFIQCLVKIACMRYVSPGVVVDVSEAVHRMFSHDIDPQLDPKIFVEGNDFRRKYAYIEEVDVVLRKHEDSLRLIFERACRMRGQNAARGIANKLVSFECWRDVCRLFNLVDVDLTERDATLAFVWSRMRVVDEQADRGRIQLTHLSFEDFLEALCRCSVCKAWPTRDQIEKAETGNAGVHLFNMKRDEPDEYLDLMEKRAVPWGGEPLQHISACVNHICWLLIVMCQQGVAGDGRLSEKEVNTFLKVVAT